MVYLVLPYYNGANDLKKKITVVRTSFPDKIKAVALASNDPPRTIIRKETLNLTESGMGAMTRRSQIEIPEELRKTTRNEVF